ncbi:siderophore ABC transporter substrate-binding protein [Peribacillus sp. SCS-155]|uniref:siderophore ABC transporter substrate-binding protein n=1 Tax=Peribacillus sedimenti TaxID=3115297 RepID=UPI003905D0E7
MKRKISLLMILAVFAVLTAACASKDSSGTGANNDSDTITVKHQFGETPVKKNPKKVVVFDFGILETMDRLGVEAAGVPKDNLPSYLDKYKGSKYENVGGLMEPNFEKINEMKPDLIIISGRQQDSYDKFAEIAPTVFMGFDYKDYMGSFKKNMTTVGEIFDKEEEVKAEVAKIEDNIESVKEHVASGNGKALITLTSGGKVTAFGPGSRFGIIHDVLGIKPAADDLDADPRHGQNISFEYLVERNPDILFVVDRDAAVGEGQSAKKVIENSLVKKTNAYKNGNIIYLNPEYWYLAGGGLVSVGEMVQEVDKGLK